MRGVDALAKTGTATAAAGGEQGLVVAVWPASAPTRGIVLLAPGAAGMDAADLAAQIATRAMPSEGGAAGLTVARPSAPAPVPSITRPAVPGEIVLRVGYPKTGGGYDVRSIPIEDYVARVLAGEAQRRSAPAALEALAITARTFAVSNRGRHQKNGFDLCTLTHCQVLREPDQAMRAAVAATSGQVLAFDGRPAQVFYTASCGGYTEKPSSVWPGAVDPPYLKVRHDRACEGEPHWASEIPEADLARVLHAAGFHGARLRDVKREGRTSSGRVKNIELSGLTPAVLSAQDFRTIVGRGLGWQLIKSTDFIVRRTRGGFYFEGHGFGHGVGLCVIGSARRADRGDSAESILDAYFPGAKIRPLASLDLGLPRQAVPPTQTLASGEGADVTPAAPGDEPRVVTPATSAPTPMPPPSTRAATPDAAPVASPSPSAPAPVAAAAAKFALVLPPTEEPNRALLTALVDRAVRDTSRATGRPAPDDLKLVFHPSSGSFGRETGEPWWSAARTRGSRIDLQPPDVLNQRGTLDSHHPPRNGARADGAHSPGPPALGSGRGSDALRGRAAAAGTRRAGGFGPKNHLSVGPRPAAPRVGRAGAAVLRAGRRVLRACARHGRATGRRCDERCRYAARGGGAGPAVGDVGVAIGRAGRSHNPQHQRGDDRPEHRDAAEFDGDEPRFGAERDRRRPPVDIFPRPHDRQRDDECHRDPANGIQSSGQPVPMSDRAGAASHNRCSQRCRHRHAKPPAQRPRWRPGWPDEALRSRSVHCGR